jgi:hypothetical protein
VALTDSTQAENRDQVTAAAISFMGRCLFQRFGNNGFINWVNNTLEIKRTANVLRRCQANAGQAPVRPFHFRWPDPVKAIDLLSS